VSGTTAKARSKGTMRRAVRLAAVQALYDMELTGHSPRQAIDAFRERGGTADLDGEAMAADGAFFTELVRGVAARAEDLDAMIAAAIDGPRQVASLESVLRAILRSGAFELAQRDDIDAAVVISEYLTVTAAFYEKAETGFVNGILDRMAKVLRSDDIPDRTESGDDG
jgi:N utilization substance protein B